ncbi:hypothetical protein F5X96DRAFT_683605 [Biscogniauxia mediterranea]|nr:hypothetical protein F5X96DRAFT_683605 [Biscogniauxia mediterranea]
MKCLGITLSLASLAFASYPAPAGPWTSEARHYPSNDGTVIDGAIQASGGKFWVGKDASTYCPSDVPDLDCSGYNGTDTVFIGGNNTLSLNVAVPGGQQVYIATDGALSYSVPHAAPPEGAVTTGFWREGSEGFMGAVFFGHNDTSAFVCPTGEENVYQVFLGSGIANCSSVLLFTYTYSGGNTWEYL